jgi:hypothetical protein
MDPLIASHIRVGMGSSGSIAGNSAGKSTYVHAQLVDSGLCTKRLSESVMPRFTFS